MQQQPYYQQPYQQSLQQPPKRAVRAKVKTAAVLLLPGFVCCIFASLAAPVLLLPAALLLIAGFVCVFFI